MQPLDTHWCNYCYQVGAFCPKRGASGSIVKGLTLLEESLATANFVEFLLYKLQLNSFLSEVERRGYRPSLPAHPERRRRYRGIAPAERLEQTGVEFSKGSNEGGAYGKGVGLGISVLLALIVISLSVWLLRRSARDESTPATPEAGEGVEAGVEEEAVVGEASTPGEAGEQKDKAQATPAAERKAEDLGVDLSQIEGTGSGGRITVKDVTEAANQA